MMSSTITLAGAAVTPLRTGLYSRLASDADLLSAACERPDRESSCRAAAAYMALALTAELLGRAGWSAPAASVTLNPTEARIAYYALSVELEAAASQAEDARRHGDEQACDRAESRSVAASDAMAGIEAAEAVDGRGA